MALVGFEWHSLPRNSVIVDVGGGIGSTSMLLASAFSSADDNGLDLRFIIQDRPIVVEMGEKVCPRGHVSPYHKLTFLYYDRLGKPSALSFLRTEQQSFKVRFTLSPPSY